jgi:hypothetical protein
MSAAPVLPMTIPAAAEVAREMWISFVGLLRSHAAMRNIAHPEAKLRVTTQGGDALTAAELLGRHARITLLAPDAAGLATMEFRTETIEQDDEYGRFFFTAEGSVFFEVTGQAMDMEAAVEALIEKVQA